MSTQTNIDFAIDIIHVIHIPSFSYQDYVNLLIEHKNTYVNLAKYNTYTYFMSLPNLTNNNVIEMQNEILKNMY